MQQGIASKLQKASGMTTLSNLDRRLSSASVSVGPDAQRFGCQASTRLFMMKKTIGLLMLILAETAFLAAQSSSASLNDDAVASVRFAVPRAADQNCAGFLAES